MTIIIYYEFLYLDRIGLAAPGKDTVSFRVKYFRQLVCLLVLFVSKLTAYPSTFLSGCNYSKDCRTQRHTTTCARQIMLHRLSQVLLKLTIAYSKPQKLPFNLNATYQLYTNLVLDTNQ